LKPTESIWPTDLQAATYNAAWALRADNRIGTIEVGHDANLPLVDGDQK
jgi:imidazolonepropionase-like amidohydrolase